MRKFRFYRSNQSGILLIRGDARRQRCYITKMQFSGKVRIDETNRLCDVIATHSARRTFVVHALEMGWSPQLVMSYTGHEDYDSMKPYIALTDKIRKHMMDTNF